MRKIVRISSTKDAQVEYIPEKEIRANKIMEDLANQVLDDNKSEIEKAMSDMMLYGTGAMFVPSNGDDPKHVDVTQIMLDNVDE